MPTKMSDIYQIAMLLEGEGTFRIGTSPLISIQMTDLDTIEKFRILTKTTGKKIVVTPKDGMKTRYTTNIYGNLAIQWMMTIYSLMSIRRKEKIKDIIEKWRVGEYTKEVSRIAQEKYKEIRSSEEYKRKHNEAHHKWKAKRTEKSLIQTIAKNRKISYEEAQKLYEEATKVN